MPNINNTLYPPQIPTYQDGFLTTETCRVYFSLSPYNSYNEIRQYAQVTVSNQNTNQSVLSFDLYPNEIKICEVKLDDTRSSDKYYIEINPGDLTNGFEINQYYKVQIRFTSANAPQPPLTALDKWLIDNVAYFSEWSRICLIRAISKPSLQLQNFVTSEDLVITTSNIDLVGTLTFNDEQEKDTLNSYQIKLYDEENNLIFDSEIIYTNIYNNPNEINYTIKYQLQNGNSYRLVLNIETKNFYTQEYEYNFLVIQAIENPLNATIEAINEEENGRIKISVINTVAEPFLGNIIIRRTDNKSNFSIWEDVFLKTYPERDLINFSWYDQTVESGVWYKYAAQKINGRGQRGRAVEMHDPILAIFEDMFLNANNKQLRIRYNPTVTSLKQNVADARSETLGSKYPFIRRNGYINYRQLSISGLITFFDDQNKIFTSKEELYGKDTAALYKDYNEENEINQYNDYIFERDFREQVIQFLYEDNVKLLRTLTEGNVLVKLMNISLSPQIPLGRYIYSFSADAYEIAECTLINYISFNIFSTVDTNLIIDPSKETIGQIQGIIAANTDVVDSIRKKYEDLTTTATIVEFQGIDHVKVQFFNEPYLIKETSFGNPQPLLETDSPDLAIALGYILYINNMPIIVNSEGVYSVSSDTNDITSISFPVESDIDIDYMAKVQEQENLAEIATVYHYEERIGQMWGSFDFEDSVYNQIWRKYYLNYSTYYQKIILINCIQVEADENTVLYVQTYEDAQPSRYIINETNLLNLQDEDLEIIDFYFGGIHLFKSDTDIDNLKYLNKYYEESQFYNSLDEITAPKGNHVYKVDNSRYIWYNGTWAIINENDDVEISVNGIVNYDCEIMRGVYA